MCRMFGYIGYSTEELNMLYTALVESSRNDVIGKKYGYANHGDGYGIVVYTKDNLFHFRSSRPIYEEAFKLPEFKGKIFGVFHTMNAHDRSLVSPIFEHPFTASNGKEVFYMAHNGVVNKQSIMEYLGINGIYNDTEAALQYIAVRGLSSVDNLEKYTESSLNLIILHLDKGEEKPEIYFKNFYLDKNKRDYSDMYTVNMPHGKAIISSTLTRYGIEGGVPANGTGLINLESGDPYGITKNFTMKE